MAKRIQTKSLVMAGMLAGISILLGATPLGFIRIGPINVATIMHIPVIIGALLEGSLIGGAIGLIFGVFSLIQAVTTPNLTSFMFINPLVSVLPRLLIGPAAFYAARLASKGGKLTRPAVAVGAVAGTLTNTVGVTGMILLLYIKPYAEQLNISVKAAVVSVLSMNGMNCLFESIIAVVVTVSLLSILLRLRKKN